MRLTRSFRRSGKLPHPIKIETLTEKYAKIKLERDIHVQKQFQFKQFIKANEVDNFDDFE